MEFPPQKLYLTSNEDGTLAGILLNDEGLEMDQLRSIQRSISTKMNIPVVLPLTDGVNEIVDGIQTFIDQ